MISASSFGSSTALLVALVAVFIAVFVIAVFLFGARARSKRRRALAHRLGRPGGGPSEEAAGTTQWVPESLAQAGHRFAEAICSRIARLESSIPAIIVMVSKRLSASRGLLQWIVLIEPS